MANSFTSDYINAVQATFKARDVLLAAGFVSVGRSNVSESCYLARPGRRLRVRIAAHEVVRDASRDATGVYLTFSNTEADSEDIIEEVDGEPVVLGSRTVKHTGLDDEEVADMATDAIAEYDTTPEPTNEEC